MRIKLNLIILVDKSFNCIIKLYELSIHSFRYCKYFNFNILLFLQQSIFNVNSKFSNSVILLYLQFNYFTSFGKSCIFVI